MSLFRWVVLLMIGWAVAGAVDVGARAWLGQQRLSVHERSSTVATIPLEVGAHRLAIPAFVQVYGRGGKVAPDRIMRDRKGRWHKVADAVVFRVERRLDVILLRATALSHRSTSGGSRWLRPFDGSGNRPAHLEPRLDLESIRRSIDVNTDADSRNDGLVAHDRLGDGVFKLDGGLLWCHALNSTALSDRPYHKVAGWTNA